MFSIRLTYAQRAITDVVLNRMRIQDGPRVVLRNLKQLRRMRRLVQSLPALNQKEHLSLKAVIRKLDQAEETCSE